MSFLESLTNLPSDMPKLAQKLYSLRQAESLRTLGEVLLTIVVGLGLGGVVVLARTLPNRWAGLILLSTMAPAVTLLVNNMRKLLLIAFIVDIPLGLDIMLLDHWGHKGGASGFSISLMTMALAAGFTIWLTNKPTSGKSEIHTDPDITLPALIYLFVLLVSAFQAVDPFFSIAQLFLEIQFFLMLFYLINHVDNWSHVRLIFVTIIGCLIVESALMVIQYMTGFELSALGIQSRATASNVASAESRIGGTLGAPNAAATFLAVSLIITFAAYLVDDWLVDKRLSLVALLLGVPALIITQSRSAWMAFVAALLVLVSRALRGRVGTRALILLGVIALIVGVGFSQQIMDRFTTDDQGSAETRLFHTQWAFNILEDHFFTGIGLNNMWLLTRRRGYLPLELMERKNLNIIHNKYLMVWVETGLFGLLSFLWLLLAAGKRAFYSLIRTQEPRFSIPITGLLGGIVVYFWHMFSDPFGARARPQLLWLIIGLIAVITRMVKETEKQGDTKDNIYRQSRT